MKELSEIIGDLIYKSEQCLEDGTHWVRADDFSGIADRLIEINGSLDLILSAVQEVKEEEEKEATCELVAFDHIGAGKIALRLNVIKTPRFPFELTIGNKYILSAEVRP